MKTMMTLNELAAVVGGNDTPEFTNISIDGIDLIIHNQFQPLPDSMHLNTKSDPECRIVWTDNGGGGR